MKKKDDFIFSGDGSIPLWIDINKVKKKRKFWKVWNALYHMGCKCQELESKVHKLEEQLTNKN